jgi:hypothetical protein
MTGQDSTRHQDGGTAAGPSAADRQALADLAARLASAGFALPGTFTERRIQCGKPHCRCARDPASLHGPYRQWTRKKNGKTVTVYLTAAQATRYQPWFANAQALRALLAEIEELSLRIASRDESWPEKHL